MQSISLADVKGESFVMLSSSRLFGALCNKFCSLAGFYPKILFESDSPVAVQNIISTGTGVAFWPEYSWGEIKNERVTLLPISEPQCQRDLIIELYERVPRAEYAENFYQFLLQQI
jgi:DNA-binding transcriptional LysR family regulator